MTDQSQQQTGEAVQSELEVYRALHAAFIAESEWSAKAGELLRFVPRLLTEVERLQAQLATAQAQRDDWRAHVRQVQAELTTAYADLEIVCADRDDQVDEVVQLRAQVEAMRDVLKRLVQLGRWDADEPDNAWRVAWETAEEVLARLDEQPSS